MIALALLLLTFVGCLPAFAGGGLVDLQRLNLTRERWVR